MSAPATSPSPFGRLLRHWRTLRRLSQFALALKAGTPARHVSFLETGRARPTQAMVLRLAAALDVPLAERNALLAAAGFGALYTARALDDAALASVRDVIGRLLASHAPLPALVLDGHYDVLDLNDGARALLAALGLAPDGAPPNLVALLLGPLRDSIVNHDDVVHDTRARLQRDLAASPGDGRLASLLADVEHALGGRGATRAPASESPVLLTTFRTPVGPLHTLSALVHFGGARDATVQGLQVELLYPADAASEALLRAVVGGGGRSAPCRHRGATGTAPVARVIGCRARPPPPSLPHARSPTPRGSCSPRSARRRRAPRRRGRAPARCGSPSCADRSRRGRRRRR